MKERYKVVKIILQQVRKDSIMLIRERASTLWQTCPRSLIHGADDLVISRRSGYCPAQLEIRILTWKAKELGL